MTDPMSEALIYAKGERLVTEGELGDCAFLILSGEVEVVKRSPRGDEVLIARLGPRELVGEMCLFGDNVRRSASVVVYTDKVEAIRLSKSRFDEDFEALPESIKVIMEVLIKRLRKAAARLVFLS